MHLVGFFALAAPDEFHPTALAAGEASLARRRRADDHGLGRQAVALSRALLPFVPALRVGV